jgi:hypothetical protein
MSKVGNFVLEVEEYVQELLYGGVTDDRILDLAKSTYGSFGLGVAQDYLDRVNGVDYDLSPY